MTNYDLRGLLSWLDFEALSKDLLEAEFGIRLENFREGADQGIDLRHAPCSGEKLIVQCKRYDKYSGLKRVLEDEELPKIRLLKPTRYIVTTTVPLSPMQVDELKELLSPFVLESGDIIGADRLNAMLAKHPEVERRHIKLWLHSAGVLDSILNAKTHVVSKEEVERTVAAAKIYVANPSFAEALEILQRERVCIISGQPGIGKTTLARMLLLYFHSREYDIVKIESDVSEARMIYHDRPRFYFYDDFLGQTAQADKLNKNEDQKLIDFMRSVHMSKASVLVLTTREYILNQARLHYEKLNREPFDHRTCVIDLMQYSRRIRAQILYNHLHFSDLPDEFRTALVTEGGYRRIVDHPNYNPRLIESMTRASWVQGKQPGDYVAEFLKVLDNPREIWAHAYTRQLSHAARHVLATMATMPMQARMTDVRQAFEAFHTRVCAQFGIQRTPDDFMTALKELDGTFVHSTQSTAGPVLRFQNPSLRDFMLHQLLGDDGILANLVHSAVFFEQAQWFAGLLREPNPQVSRDLLVPLSGPVIVAMERLLTGGSCQVSVWGGTVPMCMADPVDRAERLIALVEATAAMTRSRSPFVCSRLGALARDVAADTDAALEECVPALETLGKRGYLDTAEGGALVHALRERFLEDIGGLSDFKRLAELIRVVPAVYSQEQIQDFRDSFQSYIGDYVEEVSHSSPEEFREDADTVEVVGEVLGVKTEANVERLRDRGLDLENESEQDYDGGSSGGAVRGDHCSDAELDSMFGTLL